MEILILSNSKVKKWEKDSYILNVYFSSSPIKNPHDGIGTPY
jgi:hypothetical protein